MTTIDSMTAERADVREVVSDALIDQVLSKVDGDRLQLLGPEGVLAELTKRVLERALDAELNYYDPSTGQFLTRDPLAAVTRSFYGYVLGSPLNGADPTGLAPYANGLIPGGTCDANGYPIPPPDVVRPGTASASNGNGSGPNLNWPSVVSDGVTGYAAGLAAQSSALGSALRCGSSYAAAHLVSAGRSASMWEPLADAGPVLGGVITFGTDVASGESYGRSAANALGSTAGGYVGGLAGAAACGALAAATDGVGAVSCGF